MSESVNKGTPILEVKDLCMYFKSAAHGKKRVVKAVDSVSFDVYPSETFGIVGESGCGKTTCGRTIIRLYNPTSGDILLDGESLAGKMNRNLRKKITDNIAMIFQDPIASLNPRMTVEEIIGEGLKIRGIDDPEERRKMVYDMLWKVGLQPEHATRYPHEFSGGQRQRIGIARALIIKPKIVIADEPVSALDVSVQAQVINLLNSLKDEFGLTVIFVAHNLSVVKYFCDRIAVMYFGRLVEMADSDELFAHPCHPYTRSLLSAIPVPDPVSEKNRVRISYDPSVHNYGEENQPTYHNISSRHVILCSDSEFEEIMKGINN